MSAKEKLFDDSEYFDEAIHESITHEQKMHNLLAAIAIKPNITNYNNPTYFYASIVADDVPIFRSTSSDTPIAHAVYADTKEKWNFAPTKADTNTLYEGFLWGVPTVIIDDAEVPSLHLFTDYSDIRTSDVLIPLVGIAELFKHDVRFAALTAEQHELGYACDSKRYEIPLYRDKKTGEVVYKNATSEDIGRIIGELGLKPTMLYGGSIWDADAHPRPEGGYKIPM